MAEISYFWDGTATGDAVNAPYSSAEFSDLWDILFSSDNTAQGPIAGYLNELVVSGASSPLSIATGAALVKGRVYKNTTAATIVIPTPAASTRIDLVVLHVDENAQTIRIARVAGVEGGGAPALTQNASGPIWEIPLAQVSITTGGVCTVTDKRSFARTPLGFGSEYSELAVSVSGGWGLVPVEKTIGAGIKTTLGPGKWMLSGSVYGQTIGAGTSGFVGIAIKNNTTSTYLAVCYESVAAAATRFGIHIPCKVVTLTAQNEIELLFNADGDGDTVYGTDSLYATSLNAIRVA